MTATKKTQTNKNSSNRVTFMNILLYLHLCVYVDDLDTIFWKYAKETKSVLFKDLHSSKKVTMRNFWEIFWKLSQRAEIVYCTQCWWFINTGSDFFQVENYAFFENFHNLIMGCKTDFIRKLDQTFYPLLTLKLLLSQF